MGEVNLTSKVTTSQDQYHFNLNNANDTHKLGLTDDNIVVRDIINNPISMINGTLQPLRCMHDLNQEHTLFKYYNTTDDYGHFEIGYDQTSARTSENWRYKLLETNKKTVKLLLKYGETYRQFNVTGQDGIVRHVNIKLKGNNNAAIFSGEDKGNITEDNFISTQKNKFLVTSGQLVINDQDHSESQAQGTTIEGKLGTFCIDNTGFWQYSALNDNPGIQGIGFNESKVENFTIKSIDGTPHNISISIYGSNDLPFLSTKMPIIAKYHPQPKMIVANGYLNVSDLDLNDHPSIELG